MSDSREPLSIRQLEVFSALVEHGSFTLAGRHLGLSQSTISGHVADLERRLGVQLVYRERSGATPTAAGYEILPAVRATLRDELRVRTVAAELGGLVRGELTVAASSIPAVYLLPDWLASFRASHPSIDFRLRTTDSAGVLADLESRRVEIGLLGADVPSGMASTRVGADRLVLICAPEHPFATQSSVAVDALRGEPLVLRESGSGTRAAMEAALRTAGLEVGDLVLAVEMGSTEAAKAAVRAGLGVSLVSSLAVGGSADGLVVVPVDGLDVVRSFHLVSAPGAELTPAGRAFVDHVRAVCGDVPEGVSGAPS